jgi:hypothetical protein
VVYVSVHASNIIMRRLEGHAMFVWTYLHLVFFSRTTQESCMSFHYYKKRKNTKERQESAPSTWERNSLYLH